MKVKTQSEMNKISLIIATVIGGVSTLVLLFSGLIFIPKSVELFAVVIILVTWLFSLIALGAVVDSLYCDNSNPDDPKYTYLLPGVNHIMAAAIVWSLIFIIGMNSAQEKSVLESVYLYEEFEQKCPENHSFAKLSLDKNESFSQCVNNKVLELIAKNEGESKETPVELRKSNWLGLFKNNYIKFNFQE